MELSHCIAPALIRIAGFYRDDGTAFDFLRVAASPAMSLDLETRPQTTASSRVLYSGQLQDQTRNHTFPGFRSPISE